MSSIQKLFTSRDNQIDDANGNIGSTFVGQTGRLWYNPDNNTIRVSDGSTPGGIGITVQSNSIAFGDFIASGNTMTMVNPDESMNFVATGTGNINMFGGIIVHTDGPNSSAAFTVAPTGLVEILNPAIPSGSAGALNIVGSPTGTYQPVNGAGGMLHITGNPDTSARITVDGWTTSATTPQPPTAIGAGLLTLRAGRGTPSAPLAMKSGDHLGSIAALGYTGTGGYSQGQTGLLFYAAQDFTSNTAVGTYANLQVTPIGSSTAVTAAQFKGDSTVFNGIVNANSTLNSTSTTTGAIVTPGGVGIVQDLYVGGEVYTGYIGSVIDGLTLQAGNGSGNVNVLTGQFDVKTTTNPHPVFSIQSTGTTEIIAPAFNSSLGALNITGSADGNSVPPNQTGVMLHLTGQDGTPSRIYNDGVATYAGYIGRRFNGDVNTPLAVQNNEIMVRFGATPFNDGVISGWPSISATRIDMTANGDQTDTNLGSRIEFWTTPFNSNVVSQNITIDSNGITFAGDGSVQNTAGIPLTQRGNALGVATLDNSGKVPLAQLPAGATVYEGTWDASTNTPTLNNSSGPSRTAGYEYAVSTSGTVDFGAGPIAFNAGDFVIYSGTVWERIPTASGVTSFNTRTGAVVLSSSDVTTALTYTPYNGATNPSGYVNTAGAAAAAPVQSFNARTGAITLASSDVTTALTSGSLTNAKLSNSNVIIGNTTISLGSTVTTVAGLTSVTSTTFVGALTGAATTAGTVTTAAQPNITSTGTLTSLTTSGAITSTLATGTAPFIVTSTTQVANLNVATAGTVTTNAQPNITSTGTLIGTTLAAGTTSVAPLTFNSGVLLTSAVAGTMNYDGTTFYATPIGAQRGVISAEQFFVAGADRTYTTGTGAQASLLGVGVTLASNTRYHFALKAAISKAGGGGQQMLFALGGTATLSKVTYYFVTDVAAATQAGTITKSSAFSTGDNINTTNINSGVTASMEIFGIIDVGSTGGGTVIPTLGFSANPGNVTVAAQSYCRLFPIGASGSANTSIGTWA